MPKKVRMCVPMKVEAKINARLFKAMFHAKAVRPRLESPRVNDRKIGVLPIGLTIGNNAPTTRRVFFARSPRASAIVIRYAARLIIAEIWSGRRESNSQPTAWKGVG